MVSDFGVDTGISPVVSHLLILVFPSVNCQMNKLKEPNSF